MAELREFLRNIFDYKNTQRVGTKSLLESFKRDAPCPSVSYTASQKGVKEVHTIFEVLKRDRNSLSLRNHIYTNYLMEQYVHRKDKSFTMNLFKSKFPKF